ncbi:hypothetical protein CDAR_128201 [Caerostris darwini]|uniref:Uncharacterized protein n=1 Tax=Caerostris darwini TaxID=1538125 RepID=A0AAV4UUD7_9ARAC|nr:hypothetical protein CDAR_128201 [Caerostris darwini]
MEFSSNPLLRKYENVLFSPFAFVSSSAVGGVDSLEITSPQLFCQLYHRRYLMMSDTKFSRLAQSILNFIPIPFTKNFSPLRDINQDQVLPYRNGKLTKGRHYLEQPFQWD